MTRLQITKRVGWTAAVLAVAVLALSADAGPGKRGEKQRQRQAQKESGHHRRGNAQARSQRAERRSQDRHTSERQVNVSRTHERSQPRKAVVVSAGRHERGANWGINAQKKNLRERQQSVRGREHRVEKNAQSHRQELRQREHKLDHRAKTLRHQSQYLSRNTHHYKPTRIVTHQKSTYRSGSRHDSYGHSGYGYGYPSRHEDRSRFGFRISFGSYDSASFYYDHGHRRHTCCKGGYYTTTWVPPLRATRYDYCGDPYTVVIRAGYYKQVWVPHYCRLNLHHYNRY